MHPTAKSLILDLLSTLRRGSMPVKALVEAAALFGVAENNVRVSLARLYASGRVERDERGRYRLGPATAAIKDQVGGWRTIGRIQRGWDGAWIGVHQHRRGRGPARRRRDRALALLGFRELEPGLSLRPDNLTLSLPDVRRRLAALCDLGAGEVPGLACRMSDLDPIADLRARSLWDADVLVSDYRSSLANLDASRERLPSLSTEEAMVETFLVGGRVVRQLVSDPLLPREIVDDAPRRALLESMLDYDDLGRGLWAEFLRAHDVVSSRSPTSPVDWSAELALADASTDPDSAARQGES